VVFRAEHLLMFQWFTSLGLGGAVLRFRQLAGAYRPGLPNMLVFCAPNGMWLLSYCLALSALARSSLQQGCGVDHRALRTCHLQ
jgi:hypothetical protein